MVKVTVNLTKEEQKVIDALKVKYGLNDVSQVLSIILKGYDEHELEPQLGPEFAAEVKKARKNGRFVKVGDFSQEFTGE